MQFSLAKFMVALLFVNILAGMTFALPLAWSVAVTTLVSVLVFPPIILVGCVQTRGLRQAFFLGALVAGAPHFIGSVYYCIVLGISMAGAGMLPIYQVVYGGDDGTLVLRLIHPLCYLFGALGGLVGMAIHVFLRSEKPKAASASETQLAK